jgi:hypothetical protein
MVESGFKINYPFTYTVNLYECMMEIISNINDDWVESF